MRPLVKQWIDALRSGQYKQGKGFLAAFDTETQEVGYCCLGVVCEVTEIPKTTHTTQTRLIRYNSASVTLPYSVMVELNIRSEGEFVYARLSEELLERIKDNVDCEWIDRNHCLLSWLNDNGCDFELIADVIEDVEKKNLWLPLKETADAQLD